MEGVTNTPANICLLKVDNRTLEKGIKYVQYVKYVIDIVLVL